MKLVKALLPKEAKVVEFNPVARYLIVFDPDDIEVGGAALVINGLRKLGVAVTGVYSYAKPSIYEVVP